MKNSSQLNGTKENENTLLRGKFVKQSIVKLQGINNKTMVHKPRKSSGTLSESLRRAALRTKLSEHKRGIFI